MIAGVPVRVVTPIVPIPVDKTDRVYVSRKQKYPQIIKIALPSNQASKLILASIHKERCQ